MSWLDKTFTIPNPFSKKDAKVEPLFLKEYAGEFISDECVSGYYSLDEGEPLEPWDIDYPPYYAYHPTMLGLSSREEVWEDIKEHYVLMIKEYELYCDKLAKIDADTAGKKLDKLQEFSFEYYAQEFIRYGEV